jgi:hypothetical protein
MLNDNPIYRAWKLYAQAALLRGGVKAEQGPLRHGHCRDYGGSPTYISWQGMRSRCRNSAREKFSRYGGRGIEICDRWNDFANFLADMGERPAGTSLDRIDNDGNYEPGNCRWATPAEQRNNNSQLRLITHDGETKCLSHWCAIYGVKYETTIARLKRGMSFEAAITTPVRKTKQRTTTA